MQLRSLCELLGNQCLQHAIVRHPLQVSRSKEKVHVLFVCLGEVMPHHAAMHAGGQACWQAVSMRS